MAGFRRSSDPRENRRLLSPEMRAFYDTPPSKLFLSGPLMQGARPNAPGVLSNVVASNIDTNTVTVSVATTKGGGTSGGVLYWIISTSAVAPSVAQIVAGTDSSGSRAAASGNQTVVVAGVQTIAAAGLLSGTLYSAYFLQVDNLNLNSNIASGSFTTVFDLTSFVGVVPANFNIVNGQNFALVAVSARPPGGYSHDATTVVSGQIGPDNTTTASRIVEAAGVSNHGVTAPSFGVGLPLGNGFGEPQGVPFRFCVIAKAAERTRIVLQIVNLDGNSDQASAGFDLSGGNTGYDNSVTNWTIEATSMTAIGSGWWKCFLDWTPAGPNNLSSVSARILIDSGSGVAARSVSYSGNTNDGVLLWFASLLPKAAWTIFTGGAEGAGKEVFRDDFNSLSTIDVYDTRALGFNWYTHNHWPSTNQTGSCFFLSPATSPDAIRVSSSVLTLASDPGGCSQVLVSAAAAPSDAAGTIGTYFTLPMIYESKLAWDVTLETGGVYSGSHPAFWAESESLFLSALSGKNFGCEFDVHDGAVGAFLVANVIEFDPLNPPTSTFRLSGAACAPAPLNAADFRRVAMMLLPASAATGNKGFTMSFSEGMMEQSTMSKTWTISSHFQTERFVIILGAGSGQLPGNVPANIPCNYDFVRVIK